MAKLNCILLIDDDGTRNFLNYRVIKQLAIADCVETAVNKDKAIQFICSFEFHNNNNAPEVILLNLNAPEEPEGVIFFKALEKMNLANKRKVKIIILASTSYAEDITKLKEEYLSYINKPLTAEKLLTALNTPE
jgi:response regulator of citrate/malate metabolism